MTYEPETEREYYAADNAQYLAELTPNHFSTYLQEFADAFEKESPAVQLKEKARRGGKARATVRRSR